MPTITELIASLVEARKRHGDLELTVGPPPPAMQRAPRAASLGVFPGGLSLNVGLVPPLPTETDRLHAAIDAEAAERHAAVLPPGHRAFELTPDHTIVSTASSPRFVATVYAAPGESATAPLRGSIPLPRGAVLLSAKSADAFVDAATRAGSSRRADAGTLFVSTLDAAGSAPEAAGGSRLRPTLVNSPIVATYEVWPEHEVARFMATPIYAAVIAVFRENRSYDSFARALAIRFENWGEYLKRSIPALDAMCARDNPPHCTRVRECKIVLTGIRASAVPYAPPPLPAPVPPPEGGVAV